ncbi:MAG TPA: hypothetical protein VNE82_16775 [Candidatus Binataceae bacterium]|nr:hypothetical protein [Candidatus Binataceae bacterium]
MKRADPAALIGSKAVAWEIPSGKRSLSKTSIRHLAGRSHVSPEMFL